MARSRIAAMGASFLLILGAALGSAEAQTVGAPLPLLQIAHARTAVHAHRKAPARVAKTKPSRKVSHRHIAGHSPKGVHAKKRVAAAGRDLPAPPATRQTTPQSDLRSVWPSSASGALGYAAAPEISPTVAGHAAALTPAPPAAVKTEQVVGTDPNGILNGSHAVPAAMPNPPSPVATKPTPKPATTTGPVKTATAAPAAQKPAAHAMLLKQSVPKNAVGSASWIAQMLAALGGAIAAGAVAWFLIRPAPRRNYG